MTYLKYDYVTYWLVFGFWKTFCKEGGVSLTNKLTKNIGEPNYVISKKKHSTFNERFCRSVFQQRLSY